MEHAQTQFIQLCDGLVKLPAHHLNFLPHSFSFTVKMRSGGSYLGSMLCVLVEVLPEQPKAAQSVDLLCRWMCAQPAQREMPDAASYW